MRKPFQGLRNVVSFNWPYNAASAAGILVFGLIGMLSEGLGRTFGIAALIVVVVPTLLSLLATTHVYDLSGFYELAWLDDLSIRNGASLVNINAGFDETSEILTAKFPHAELIAYDFFDPKRHTEPSISRARRAYPPFKDTIAVSTNRLPFDDGSTDFLLAIMSLHEIRQQSEREIFFIEIRRVLAVDGRAVVVEHTRDAANILAYNFGAWHFHPRAEWLRNFHISGLSIEKEMKLTPLVSAFFLRKNGNSS